MPNTPVPAAVTGLPIEALPDRKSFSRRAMLRGSLAATVTTAATVAVASPANVPACHAGAPAASPRLLALAAALSELLAEQGQISVARNRVAATWADRWPLAPDEITFPLCGRSACAEREMRGIAIRRPGEAEPRGVIERGYLLDDIGAFETDLRRARSEGKRAFCRAEIDSMRRLLATADGYAKECARLRDVSGIAAIDARAEAVRQAIKAKVADLLAQPATTLADFVLKAWAIDESECLYIEARDLCAELAALAPMAVRA